MVAIVGLANDVDLAVAGLWALHQPYRQARAFSMAEGVGAVLAGTLYDPRVKQFVEQAVHGMTVDGQQFGPAGAFCGEEQLGQVAPAVHLLGVGHGVEYLAGLVWSGLVWSGAE
ncbi:hypothetical protein ACJU26_05550 [Acidithiobacillus sp. M4-SHS-6]|uniref:hypothetical protein n=1 Tax=Acidithiobacillus sp. M4-SHS-6 TaxID=3383024 RepID=UPI0039BE7B5F